MSLKVSMNKQGYRFLYPGRELVGSTDKLTRPLQTVSIHFMAKVTKNNVLQSVKVSLWKFSRFEIALSLTY